MIDGLQLQPLLRTLRYQATELPQTHTKKPNGRLTKNTNCEANAAGQIASIYPSKKLLSMFLSVMELLSSFIFCQKKPTH